MLIADLKQVTQEHITLTFENGEQLKTTLGVVTEFRAFKGRDLDVQTLEAIKERSTAALLLERTIEYLSRSRKSERELKQWMMRKGAEENIADTVIEKLLDMQLIDDESYASAVARHYAAKGYGQGRIKAELSRRGVSRDYWEDAVDAMPDNSAKIDKIIRSKLTDPEDKDQIRKVSSTLFRRGFSWDEIKKALERYSAEIDEEY